MNLNEAITNGQELAKLTNSTQVVVKDEGHYFPTGEAYYNQHLYHLPTVYKVEPNGDYYTT